MSRLTIVCAIATLALSCTKVNPDALDAGGTGNDAAVARDCTPNTSQCTENIELVCDSEGNLLSTTDCALGCFDEERCARRDPSNGLAGHLDAAADAEDVVWDEAVTIDTTAGTVTDVNGAIAVESAVMADGPVDVFVVAAKSFEARDVTVVGEAALAIVSAGDVTLRGVVDVSAVNQVAGPGAATDDTSCLGKDGNSFEGMASGGGGGGFGRAGGAGGSTEVFVANGGLGGEASGTPELAPLRGGCRGGFGVVVKSVGPSSASPGAGGGAIQIVSGTLLSLEDGGAIRANGGGAKALTMSPPTFCLGSSPAVPCFPAHGGGSGGAILLEAPSVLLVPQASLVANGGAGHCGKTGVANNGGNGESPALGTRCEDEALRGNGGDGGAGETSATAGGSIFDSAALGGGGGGGVGRIRINLPDGREFAREGTISPTNTAGELGIR